MTRGRRPEPRITDLATHPRQRVSLVVAAKFLEIDVRTLNGILDEGKLPFVMHGRRKRILLSDLAAYDRQCRTTVAPMFHEKQQRHT